MPQEMRGKIIMPIKPYSQRTIPDAWRRTQLSQLPKDEEISRKRKLTIICELLEALMNEFYELMISYDYSTASIYNTVNFQESIQSANPLDNPFSYLFKAVLIQDHKFSFALKTAFNTFLTNYLNRQSHLRMYLSLIKESDIIEVLNNPNIGNISDELSSRIAALQEKYRKLLLIDAIWSQGATITSDSVLVRTIGELYGVPSTNKAVLIKKIYSSNIKLDESLKRLAEFEFKNKIIIPESKQDGNSKIDKMITITTILEDYESSQIEGINLAALTIELGMLCKRYRVPFNWYRINGIIYYRFGNENYVISSEQMNSIVSSIRDYDNYTKPFII